VLLGTPKGVPSIRYILYVVFLGRL
jgi:hypothetical protein